MLTESIRYDITSSYIALFRASIKESLIGSGWLCQSQATRPQHHSDLHGLLQADAGGVALLLTQRLLLGETKMSGVFVDVPLRVPIGEVEDREQLGICSNDVFNATRSPYQRVLVSFFLLSRKLLEGNKWVKDDD